MPAIPSPPPHPAVIRAATVADYAPACALFDALDALHRVARPDMFRAIVGPARTRAYVEALIGRDDRALLVADSGGALLGLVVLLEHQTTGLPMVVPRRVVVIDNLVVRADARRAGVGRALLAAADAWARTRDAESLEVAVHEFNAEALAFYQAVGYAPSTRRLRRRLVAAEPRHV